MPHSKSLKSPRCRAQERERSRLKLLIIRHDLSTYFLNFSASGGVEYTNIASSYATPIP